MKPKTGSVAEWEIAIHMAFELYPMDKKKRQEYVKWALHRNDPIIIRSYEDNLHTPTKNTGRGYNEM